MDIVKKIKAVFTFCIQFFIIFPYSALTITRQRILLPKMRSNSITQVGNGENLDAKGRVNTMISDRVYRLCRSEESVSSRLAEVPSMEPGDAWKELFEGGNVGEEKRDRVLSTEEKLQRAFECGKWGTNRPSDLFLQLYHDALCTLNDNLSNSMVSLPLMGSCGVIPLTIISTVPDIMRHMSNIIVRAEREVILATNYWQNSVASKYITNAMKELSKRAGSRGDRIVFKLEYDRGSPKQLFDNHMDVPEKDYLGKAVALPAKHEIPNIDLQVTNYHRPMLGTFHCKYMVVDRKVTVLQSNNIQDNDNLEMMTHLEGPIVDSLYDMALISWDKKMIPSLPSHNSPAVKGGVSSLSNQVSSENGTLNGNSGTDLNGSAADGTILTGPSTTESVTHPVGPPNGAESGVPSGTNQAPSENVHTGFESKDLRETERVGENIRAAAMTADFEHIAHQKETNGNGIVSKAVNGAIAPNKSNGKEDEAITETNGNTENLEATHHGINGPDLASQKYFNFDQQSLPQSQIEKSTPHSDQLPEHTTDDPHYDVDIAGEVARVQNAVSPKNGETRVEAVTRHLNHTKNPTFKGDAPDCPQGEEMTPYIPHEVHEPFPIAMVCREPYGTPNHDSVSNPQNATWLSALRNAKKNVFIQSPTLNAEPLVPAIIEACERGIDVFIYTCLGYNDTGELLPMQGGTNEMIAHTLHTSTLSPTGKQHLHYFFYTGKDMLRPIVAVKKKRCCHVKVMIVDEYIGIQGNGNQDTQSWYHSQEINIMFESRRVCGEWIEGLSRNQNTHLYGGVGRSDGVWRDEGGKQAEDVIGVDPGRFSWARGFVGAVNRVRGTGDF